MSLVNTFKYKLSLDKLKKFKEDLLEFYSGLEFVIAYLSSVNIQAKHASFVLV